MLTDAEEVIVRRGVDEPWTWCVCECERRVVRRVGPMWICIDIRGDCRSGCVGRDILDIVCSTVRKCLLAVLVNFV
jgi:hypothetical protein